MNKNLIILLLLCIGLSRASFGQVEIWSVNASDYVGKWVKFDELANKVDYNSVTKTCNIFLADPDVANSPTITVVIHNVNKGKHLRWLQNLELETITVTGKLIRTKNGFIINGNDARTKIEAEKNYKMIEVPEVPPTTPSPPSADTARHQ